MPGRSSSINARGAAVRARDLGAERGVKGFERGGEKRQAANRIVHAPLGEARKHAISATTLLNKATHTPTKFTVKKA